MESRVMRRDGDIIMYICKYLITFQVRRCIMILIYSLVKYLFTGLAHYSHNKVSVVHKEIIR